MSHESSLDELIESSYSLREINIWILAMDQVEVEVGGAESSETHLTGMDTIMKRKILRLDLGSEKE